MMASVMEEADDSEYRDFDLYNRCLPPPVAAKLVEEEHRFHQVVLQLRESWQPGKQASVTNTLKFLYIIQTFLKARSKIAIEDIQMVVDIGLEVILEDCINLHAQTKWTGCLSRIYRKYGKRLTLEIEWKPFYNILLNLHFGRQQFYKGKGMSSEHAIGLVGLIRQYRYFFVPGSATEIWNTFRPCFDYPSRHSCVEAAGFLSLFLPTKLQNSTSDSEPYVFTSEWMAECFQLWQSVPSCDFWSSQWTSLITRCIMRSDLDWEPFMPKLFNHILNAFWVPVGKAGASPPVDWTILSVPSALQLSIPKNAAKCIVNLLGPGSSGQLLFEKLVDYLEAYYHPSNGGSWTDSLEKFLKFLVHYFTSRLKFEGGLQSKPYKGKRQPLGQSERAAFVKTLLRLVERGQYSKSDRLAQSCARTLSLLSYIEPSLSLPIAIASFETAMDSITATHQLEIALKTLALCVRPILLLYQKERTIELVTESCVGRCWNTVVDAMFKTLPGLDANDPPKTLATLQLYCSVLSNVSDFEVSAEINWERWSFEFIDHLFRLLQSLEPGDQSAFYTDTNLNDGFLTDRDSNYYALLMLLFSKLSKDNFRKVLMRLKRFMAGNVLPGAVYEVAYLCSAAIDCEPSSAIELLLLPIMKGLISSLREAPSTGFCSNELACTFDSKEMLSPILEKSASYQVNIIAMSLSAGPALLNYKEILKDVVNASFNAPSVKVNNAGKLLLQYLIQALVCYYPLRDFNLSALEGWIGAKDKNVLKQGISWHIPSTDEILFVRELMQCHMHGPLSILECVADNKYQFKSPGQEKDYLRVTLSRLESVLRGLSSCIRGFHEGHDFSVVGYFGPTIADSDLRSEIATVLHKLCRYVLENKGDESIILKLLVSLISMVVNSGVVESNKWAQARDDWEAVAENLTEPAVTFLTNYDTKCSRRPLWLVYERIYIQSLWRSSESHYYDHFLGLSSGLPAAVELLGSDILNIGLHRYKAIRLSASAVLGELLEQYPLLPQKVLPLLISSLKDPNAPEESAIGACAILKMRTVIRYLMEDWSSLSAFLASLLNSGHHNSTKVEKAVDQLFISFNWYFGAVSINTHLDGTPSYESTVSHIKSFVAGGSTSVHWRYNLMARALLLFLTLSPSSHSGKESLELVRKTCEHYLESLTSELPALRLLSVIAVLLLLGAESDKMREHALNGSITFEHNILNENFGESIIKVLSLDHHFREEDGINVPQTMSDLWLVYLMPTYMHIWPGTRTWDSKMRGVGFSEAFAKLFEELTRKYGETVVAILRRPLEDASCSSERGKQCTAAEIIAGLLRSNSPCISAVWQEWLSGLLQQALKNTTLECAPEWVACIRYAMGAEDRSGHETFHLRHKLLECLGNLLPPSAPGNLVARRLNILIGALLEVHPKSMSIYEANFQASLLLEVMDCTCHSSLQVRKAAGSLICILSANLYSYSSSGDSADGTKQVVAKCMKTFVHQAASEARKIQDINDKSSDKDVLKKDKKAVREMETVFHFLLTCLKSGHIKVLADITVQLVHPLLLLQETSEKELRALARSALRYLKWQVFPPSVLQEAVLIILKAANEDNWHVRAAAISFMQPFVYRHSFTLEPSLWQLLWGKVLESLCDRQLEVREIAATTAAGMMKGAESGTIECFRTQALATALSIYKSRKPNSHRLADGLSVAVVHGAVLALAACVLSVPYDIPSWLPEMVTTVTYFSAFPWPIRATVTKTIGEFRRTHSDTWDIQKEQFTEDQLELLFNAGTASYFA